MKKLSARLFYTKKIVFVIPPSGLYRRDDRCQSKVEEQTVRIIFPPIDFAQLAAIAERNKKETKIIDYPAIKKDIIDPQADLLEFKPDMIIIDTAAGTLRKDLEFITFVKSILPEIITIAKGESISHFSEEIFNSCPALDFVIYGECEESFEKLLTLDSYEEIPGLIYYNEKGKVVSTGTPPPVENLDSLPIPDRSLLDNKLYISPETGNPLTTIQGNRGCPSHCIFCPAGKISGYKIRYRSPDIILAELKECVEKHGIKEFLFHGDTFTMNKKWLIELCDKIVAAGLKIRWGCNSRTDTFDEERAIAMKKAGCWVVAFGIESGSPMMLEKIKKGSKIEASFRAVDICRKAGLRSHAFYVIGLPWETEQTISETLEFAKKLDTDFFDFNIAFPLPGTELYEIASKEGLIVNNQSPLESGSYGEGILKTYTLSPEYLTDARRRMLLTLYLRPKYILRTLKNAGSPLVIFNYVKAAVKRLMQLI